MPYTTLNGGLPLVVPTAGTRNWSDYLNTNLFQKIVDHDHTSGKGTSIVAGALASNAVTTAKILDAAVTQAKMGLTWTTWSPTWGAINSMTFTSVTTNYAKYIQMGKLVVAIAEGAGTVDGTPSTALTITLPVNAQVSSGNYLGFGSALVVNGGAGLGGTVGFASATTVNIARYDGGNFSAAPTAGTARVLLVYESV